MFKAKDWVWHDKYGRGQVAAPQGPMTYVLWDDMSKNESVETAVPTTEDEEGNTIVLGPSPLVGHYINVDEAAIKFAHEDYSHRTPGPKEEGEQPFHPEFFNPGWFKVVKVDQKFMFKWDEEQQRYIPRPKKGQYILTLENSNGKKIPNFVTAEPGFDVPGKYATNTLSKILEGEF